jgi:IS6 family transposase
MRPHRYLPPCPAPRSAFYGYRFAPEVITLAVRSYLRFGLSYRDVEELLSERGIQVDHASIYRWVQRFAPQFAEAARAVSTSSGIAPVEVTTDRYRAYPRIIDELLPAAFHDTEAYANNPIETDHGRLKARLRPMRGLKRDRTARVIVASRAFVQNLRSGF